MSDRTFKPRRRRLSPTRQQRFDERRTHWVIEVDTTPIYLAELFGHDQPVVLDVGIGGGESCVEMATADPIVDIIGIDVHTPGIASAVLAIDERGLTNLRLYEGDVFDLVDRLEPGSVAGMRVFFPDPWPKARHRRRRLVTADRLDRLLTVVADDGWLHLATDIDDYAAQMRDVCDARADLDGGPVERPAERPLTRYEARGVDAGRTITDLWYRVSRVE